MGSKDYGHRPYVDDHLGYVENITNLTRKALQDAGISILAPQPYFDVGMNEQYYNSQGVDDPRRRPTPKPLVLPEKEVTSPLLVTVGCGSTTTLVFFCPLSAPVSIQFSHVGGDYITSVAVISGDGSVSYDDMTQVATYTPSGAATPSVVIEATTVGQNKCQVVLYSNSNCCAGTGNEGISYTTIQMQVNGTQTLTGTNLSAECLLWGQYTWEITAGGGSLSVGVGASTVYTAPATNANCASNPTIALKLRGVPLATLRIAVNQYSLAGPPYYHAVEWCFLHAGYGCFTYWPCLRQYLCDGSICPANQLWCNDKSAYCGAEEAGYCIELGICGGQCIWPDQWHDVRTSGMISGGCCPYQLM